MAKLDWDELGRLANERFTPPVVEGPPASIATDPGGLPPLPADVPLAPAQQQQLAGQIAQPNQMPQGMPGPAPIPQGQPPPGMIPLQQTVTQSQLPPELLKQQDKLLGKQLQATDKATEAQIAQNTLIAEQAKQNTLMLGEQNRLAAEQQAKDAEMSAQAQANVQKVVDDFNVNKTVNPGRAYERMGVGGRILATIGQAFGAFGAAITHSPNYAQQMIERAVDADIRSQEQDIAARGQAVNMANNQYGMFRQRGLDNQAALAATRVNMLQQAQAKVDELLAGSKNEMFAAKGAEVKAGLQQSALNTLMHYGQTHVSTVKQNAAATASAGAQLPANEAEKLGTANAAIQATVDIYNNWKKDASGAGGYIASKLPGTDATAFGDKRAMAKQVIGSYLEGGVLRKEDEAKYDKYLPEAGDSIKRAMAKRDSLMALISQRATAQKKALMEAGFKAGGVEIKKPVTTFKPLQ